MIKPLLLNLGGHAFRVEGDAVGEKLELNRVRLRASGRLVYRSDLLECGEGRKLPELQIADDQMAVGRKRS